MLIPSLNNLRPWSPCSVLDFNFVTFLLSLSIQGHAKVTSLWQLSFIFLYNIQQSILALVDMPFLWGYSDLFTTFPSPFFSSNHSFARPHCWSFITDTAVPPSLSSIFSCSCLCLLDSLPCCLLTALAFLGSSPSTLYSVQFVITSFIPFHLYHLNACILNWLFPFVFSFPFSLLTSAES